MGPSEEEAFRLGVEAKQAGRVDDAERLWRIAARSSDPGLAGAALTNIGTEQANRGELDAALETLGHADSLGNPRGALNHGLALEMKGDGDGAEVALRRADERGELEGTYRLGCLLRERGDRDAAEVVLRRAAEAGSAEAANDLGVLLGQAGQVDEARRFLSQADAAGLPDGSYNLGGLLDRQGELVEAETALRRADLRGHREAAKFLGRLLYRRGEFNAAERAFERGDAIGDGVASHLLGTLLMDRGDLAAATMVLERALDRGVDDAGLALGNVYDRAGREADALGALTRAARAGNAEAARRLGEIHERRGELPEATQFYEDAAKGGDAAAILWLGLRSLDTAVELLGSGKHRPRRRTRGQEDARSGTELLRRVALSDDLEPAWKAAFRLRELYRLPPGVGELDRIISAPSLDQAMAVASGAGRDTLAAIEAEARQCLSGPCPQAAYPLLLLGSRVARAAALPELAAQLLLLQSDAAMAMGDKDYAAARASEAAEDARSALDAGVGAALASLVRADIRTFEWELDNGDPQSARGRLADLRLRAFRLGSLAGQTWASAGLAYVQLMSGNAEAARPYAMLAADTVLEGRALSDVLVDDLPDREMLASVMLRISDFEVSRGAFESALEFARRSTALRPDHGAGPLAEAKILKELGRLEESITAFDAALLHDPPSRVDWLSYRADCFVALERFEEALTAMDEIVAAAPDQAESYINRAQVHRARDELQEAIADYRRGLALAVGRDSATALGVAAIVECLLELGELDSARTELGALLDSADASQRLTGRLLLSRLHWLDDRPDDALAVLDTALIEQPGQPDCLISRAYGLIELGRHREALPALAELAERLPEPDAVIPYLDSVLAVLPGDTEALKWRGRAQQRAQRPSRALEDLTRVLASNPDDWQALLWRGLARISRSALPEEQEFNDTLTRERVLDGLEDLAAAAAHAPEPEGPLAAYCWVVDRVSADSTLQHELIARAEQPYGLFTTVPTARQALELWVDGSRAAAGDGREIAIARLGEAQEVLRAAGLETWARRLDLTLADVHIRADDLQAAIAHVELAKEYRLVVGGALTPLIDPSLALGPADTSTDIDIRTVVREAGYDLVYEAGRARFENGVAIVGAELRLRLGDVEAALDELGDVDELVAELCTREFDPDIDPFDGLIRVAEILREAAGVEEAAKLVPLVMQHATDDRQRLAANNFAGNVALFAGDPHGALDHYREAFRLASGLDSRVGGGIAENIAGCLMALGRPSEGLAQLDAQPAPQGESDSDRYASLSLRAQLYGALERPADAERTARAALEIADQARGQLRTFNARISWQSRHERLFGLAIRAALDAGRPAAAMELVEQAKTRTLADELTSGTLKTPEPPTELVQLAARTRHQLELLQDLAAAPEGYLDFEIAGRAGVGDLIEGGDLDHRGLSARVARLRNHLTRIEEELAQASVPDDPPPSAAPITIREIQALLSA